MNSLVSEKILMQTFGTSRRSDLRRYLDQQHIPYYLGKGGCIVTTIEAINYPLIGHSKDDRLNITTDFD